MDSKGLLLLLEQFEDDIDDLEESLEPILKTSLSTISSKLPLLDKAKLYILVTYAIESILFSYLRLNSINAREQPVFKELTRVRQYFDKIKALDHPDTRRPVKLDKGAAARFIKAGLTRNDASHYGPGKTKTGEAILPDTKLQEVRNMIYENVSDDQLDISSSDREDEIPNTAISPRKRKAIDSGPNASLSHDGLDVGTSSEKPKMGKRQKLKSKNKEKDN